MSSERKAVVEQVSTPWMLTFADLLALLLTFFVLLFSMNTVKFDDWKSVVDTMSEQFNPKRAAVDIDENTSQVIVQKPRVRALNLNYVSSLVRDTIRSAPQLAGIQLYQEGGRLAISVPGNLLFEEGSDVLAEGAQTRIRVLANTLFVIKNQLIVAGHAKQTEVNKTRDFGDAWQLGLARSRIVAQMLRDNGYAQPVISTSYGSSRSDDIANTLSVTARDIWANRVDIIIIEERRDSSVFDL